MLLDPKEANYLLNALTPGRRDPNEQDPYKLFVEFYKTNWEDKAESHPDADTLWDRFEALFDNLLYEMKDFNFAFMTDVEDFDDEMDVFFELKCYEEYDQHVTIKELEDLGRAWTCQMECSYAYLGGDKDKSTIRAELEAMGGTYSKTLEECV
jgi:hypothetical protein